MQRDQIKKIYKAKRLKDGKHVGQRITALTQTLLDQTKLPREQRDVTLITSTAQELKDLRSEPRFRDEFPSFAKFWNFIKDTNRAIYKENLELPPEKQKALITIKDLQEI